MTGVNRALAVLTGGAYLTLLIGVLGTGYPTPVLLLGAAFTLVSLVAFPWLRRRGRLGLSVVYVLVQLALAVAVFAHSPSTGASLLQVVLVSQAVLLLPTAGVVALVLVLPFIHAPMPAGQGLREGFGTFVVGVFTAVVTTLLVREQRARAELAAAHTRLREYAAQAEELATAQERNRVARDIHDGLGHALTVVQMQVKAARAVLPTDPATADAVLDKAQRQAETALTEVRRSVRALREPRPAPPLPAALHALAAENTAAGVPTEVAISGTPRPLPDATAEALYRAAQEGLTNVRKHAQASRADLRLDFAAAAVALEVRDDGAGTAADHRPGYGLLGLGERAAQLGGRFSVDSAPGHGVTLRMEVPA